MGPRALVTPQICRPGQDALLTKLPRTEKKEVTLPALQPAPSLFLFLSNLTLFLCLAPLTHSLSWSPPFSISLYLPLTPHPHLTLLAHSLTCFPSLSIFLSLPHHLSPPSLSLFVSDWESHTSVFGPRAQ